MARSQSPADKLLDIAYELAVIAQRQLHHYDRKEYSHMALDVSAIVAATAQINTVASEIGTGTTAAQQEATDQAAVDAAAKPLSDAVAALAAKVAPPAPASLTVAPVSFSAGGGAQSAPLSVTGGTGPFSVTGLPTGISSDGVNVSDDGTSVAGTTDATVTDSSTPALTGQLAVTVA